MFGITREEPPLSIVSITKAKEAIDAKEALLGVLSHKQTVYVIIRNVSRTGMQRKMDFYAVQHGRNRYLTGYVASALGLRRDKETGACLIHGAGMDMAFGTVYELSQTLFGDGYMLSHEVL